MLCACGTTSSLRNAANPTKPLSLAKYNNVIVNDFKDGTTKSHNDPVVIKSGKKFSDLIASKIIKKKIFNKVERKPISTPHTIIIEGTITQCEEGNKALRTAIGLGTGISHFDATVILKDNRTKKTLGNIDVNKMSWALGGITAGMQDVDSHMESAASSIADALEEAKKN